MQRRKFLVGMGSLAAGGAATMGTGAFKFNTAFGRTVEMEVQADDDGYIGLIPTSPYAEYGTGVASSSPDGNGALVLDFDLDPADGGGDGPNNNARTRLCDIFKVVNQQYKDVEVKLDNTPGDPARNGLTSDGQDVITWYTVAGGASDPGGAGCVSPNDSAATILADSGGPQGTITLGPGDNFPVSVAIDLADNTGSKQPGTDLGGDIGIGAKSV